MINANLVTAAEKLLIALRLQAEAEIKLHAAEDALQRSKSAMEEMGVDPGQLTQTIAQLQSELQKELATVGQSKTN